MHFTGNDYSLLLLLFYIPNGLAGGFFSPCIALFDGVLIRTFVRSATKSPDEAFFWEDHSSLADADMGWSVHDTDRMYKFRRNARGEIAHRVSAYILSCFRRKSNHQILKACQILRSRLLRWNCVLPYAFL